MRGSNKVLGTFLLGFFIASVLVGYQFGISLGERANSSTIIEPASFQDEASYIIFQDGSNTKARNGATGAIDYSSTDDDSVIQNCINVLSNGGRIFIKAGTYTINSEITLVNNIELCGEGRGSTILYEANGANLAKILKIYGKSNVYVHDLTLDGNSANNPSGECLIRVDYSSSKIHIYNMELLNSKSGSCTLVNSNYLFISHIYVKNVGANQCFGVRNVHYSLFDNLVAMDCNNNWGFDFSHVTYSTISNLYMEGSTGTGIKIDPGDTDSDICHHLTVNNIVLRNVGNGNEAIKIKGVKDSAFTNLICDSGVYNIRITQSEDLVFNGGHFFNNGGHNILMTSSVARVTILGFLLEGGGSSHIGIKCEGYDCIITGNIISDRTGNSILLTSSSSNCLVYGNRVFTSISDSGTNNMVVDNIIA